MVSKVPDLYVNFRMERIIELNSSLEIVENKFMKISNVYEEIISLVDEEHVEGEIGKQDTFEEYAYKEIHVLKNIIKKKTEEIQWSEVDEKLIQQYEK